VNTTKGLLEKSVTSNGALVKCLSLYCAVMYKSRLSLKHI